LNANDRKIKAAKETLKIKCPEPDLNRRFFSKRVASAVGGSASGGKEYVYARHSYQCVRSFMLYVPKKTRRFFEPTPFYSPSLNKREG
jgi:hypothetical protein